MTARALTVGLCQTSTVRSWLPLRRVVVLRLLPPRAPQSFYRIFYRTIRLAAL
jgi:hypothetical protein